MIAIDHSRERLQRLLESAGAVFKGKKCRCIFHDDANASADLYERDGVWRFKCQSCGAGGDLLDVQKLLGDKPAIHSNGNGKGKIVKVYDYTDESGNVLFQKVRYEPKGFSLRRPDGNGGMGNARRVLYRLPELIAATAETVIFLPEGEKDSDNLIAAGLVSTTNFEGASKAGENQKWRAEYNSFFHNRIVAIVADKDGPGRARADHIARQLAAVAKEVRVFEVPGDACKDASDYISAGGDAESLMELFDAAPIIALAQAPAPVETNASGAEPVLTCLADVETRPVKWLWPNRVPLGRITLLVGRPGEGKSFLTTDMCARVSTGSPWPDKTPCERGSALIIAAEDDAGDTVRPRCDACGADLSKIHILSGVEWRGEDGKKNEVCFTLANIAALEEAMRRIPDLKFIVIDPIGSYLGGKVDAHRDNEVRGVLAPIAKLAEKYGVAVLIVAHRRKSAGDHADDMALGSRAFTGIARTVWHLSRHPDDKKTRLLLPGKNNLAPEGDGLAFQISGDPPKIWWGGIVAMSADEALAAEQETQKHGPEPEARDEAAEWLRKLLGMGELAAADVQAEAKGAGMAWRTVQRAADALKVERFKPSFGTGWRWRLPPAPQDATKMPSCSQEKLLGNLAQWEKPVEKESLLGPLDDCAKLNESGGNLASSAEYTGEPGERTQT